MKIKYALLITLLLLVNNVRATEWQWSVEIKGMLSDETKDHPRAFLWIPTDCKQVRGIVVGMHNMQEEGILEHDKFRKTMSGIDFAEIWVTPGIDPMFDVTKGAQTAFDEMLASLADVSGYSELKFVPIVPIGHSAYATYPWNFAAWNSEKTLAILSVHGDAPLTNLTGCGRQNLDWGNRTIEGIPALMVMGEYEWWEDRLAPAFAYKKKYPKAPISLLADAGHGHFDYSDMLVDYLALFIKKAAHYRLPQNMPLDKLVILKPIDPTLAWLADRWHPHQSLPTAKTAPYNQYTGDKSDAFWYFDKEMATQTEKYYTQARGKKEQYIGFMQNDKFLDFDAKSHARINAKFEPESDGLTFHVSAVFTDSLRKEITTDHSNKAKIKVDRICGPVEKINDSTFTLCFYRMGLNSEKRTGDIWLIGHHEGDGIYKSSVQQLNLRIPYPNKEGKEQHITFPELKDVPFGTKSISLSASSDSGLPVYYYIQDGAAEIAGDKILLIKVPPRAKYPARVTVVAWQYGTTAEPQIQTAVAVKQTFLIYK